MNLQSVANWIGRRIQLDQFLELRPQRAHDPWLALPPDDSDVLPKRRSKLALHAVVTRLSFSEGLRMVRMLDQVCAAGKASAGKVGPVARRKDALIVYERYQRRYRIRRQRLR